MEIVPDNKDETLLFAIIGFIRLSGIKVLPQSYLMKNLFLKLNAIQRKNQTLMMKKLFLLELKLQDF